MTKEEQKNIDELLEAQEERITALQSEILGLKSDLGGHLLEVERLKKKISQYEVAIGESTDTQKRLLKFLKKGDKK